MMWVLICQPRKTVLLRGYVLRQERIDNRRNGLWSLMQLNIYRDDKEHLCDLLGPCITNNQLMHDTVMRQCPLAVTRVEYAIRYVLWTVTID